LPSKAAAVVRARGRGLRQPTGAQRQAARGGGSGRGRSGRRLQGQRSQAVVTNLEGEPDPLYDGLYCQRGEAENRIKEAQLDLFGTRASRSRFMANQFPLLLAALAYTLMQRLIGEAILRNTRRARAMLASHHPLHVLFATAASRLAALGPSQLIQCLARALTPTRPASQAGAGAVTPARY
jgi:hypothetical protein